MFLTFDEEKCPVCGVSGVESQIKELNECPNCGTKFNKFGIVMAENVSLNLHWN